MASLVRAVRRVLRDGLKAGGTTFGRYADADGRPGANQQNLNVFRRTGQPCPRCGTAVESESIGGRTKPFLPQMPAALVDFDVSRGTYPVGPLRPVADLSGLAASGPADKLAAGDVDVYVRVEPGLAESSGPTGG